MNTRKRKYRFNICNLHKSNSSFVEGMKPVMISERAYELNQTGWTRVGEEVSYYPTLLQDSSSMNILNDANYGLQLYTLSFVVKFEHANDTGKIRIA